ncbi:NAD(P)/FAD-dependent oxidoreductase [Erythrobacter longus]|uniref:NAD(P)/FAD-dependent oxidoreductase n=1 Tax=Erythrobacter longus TaxID=1044 RepID=UPI0005516ABF|nr:FAD-dependent oxidoreductase [Erythrobacter longus]
MEAETIRSADFLVIGAGIAGLSLAARLAQHGVVIVLEAEDAPGYHASGRSVAFAHFGLGEKVVRTLTALSLADLSADPVDDRARYARPHRALHIARTDQVAALDALDEVHKGFGCDCERITGEEARALIPALKAGPDFVAEALLDHGALKLDTDAMLQGNLRDLRARGGELVCGAMVQSISRRGKGWGLQTTVGNFAAPVLVNASGAWADEIAQMARVTPIGIEPRRRTVIAFASPEGTKTTDWPFVKTVGEGFYFLPEGTTQLLASPQDEGESEPCDAAPEEIDIATIAHRIEEATDLKIERIAHSWAGLRSFAPDELPVVGFAPDAPGFFWCAGQGGYGFQTSPALAHIGEILALGREWPSDLKERGITPALFAPGRFSRAT